MTKSGIQKLALPFVLSLLMAVLLWSIGYKTPRTNFTFFFSQYVLAFTVFYLLWLNRSNLTFRTILILALIFRLILLFAVPELSNDFYRFLWDGELMTKGVNPFAHSPEQLLHTPAFYANEYATDANMRILYHGMGELSQQHYTCYPVLNQFFFYISAAFSNNILSNVIILRILLILADLGAIYYAKKIAEHLNVPVHNIWLYALNPFIILEFTGNLHFEGVMIFFLLASLYGVLKNNWLVGALLFGCAIQIKLLPLMLLPFLLKKLKWRLSIGFLAMVALTVILIGSLMLNEQFYHNMMESINEYFVRFQFNGSISYLVSWIGQLTIGWDPILYTGPVLSLIATFGILTLALLKAYRNELDIFKGMLFALMIYYSLTATVHPWYISLILVLSVFTRYKFGLIWSLLVMLSYSAYGDVSGFKENPVFIIAEYGLVYIVLFYEIVKYWKLSRVEKEGNPVGIQLKAFFGIK